MSSVPPYPPPPPPPASTPPPESPGAWGGGEPPRPRLARRSTDKVLGGVCGGLADHLGLDVTVIRVAAVLLAMTGWGVLLYLIGWAALPVSDAPPQPRSATRGRKGKVPWLPVVLVIALLFTVPSGFSVLFGDVHMGNAMVPVLLLGGVAYFMWRATHGDLPGPRGRHGAPVRGPGWVAPPPPQGHPTPAVPDDRPLWARDDDPDTISASPAAHPRPAGDAGSPAPPAAGDEPDEDPLLAEARRLSDPFLTEPLLFETAPALPAAPGAPGAPPSPSHRRGAGRAALAALLIGVGAVGLAIALGMPFAPFTVLAGALVAIGVALVLGGLRGRASRGLVIPGLIVLGLLTVVSLVDLPSVSAGERIVQLDHKTQIQPSYELGVGELTIDLSRVQFAATDDIDLAAHLGAGELHVIVPEDVTVVVDASAKAGELHVLNHTEEGIKPDVSFTDPGSREGGGTLNLDLDLGVGELTVDRAEAGAERPDRPERPVEPDVPQTPSVP
jgi:phage shock protein PspC (stress-responsive transcriptional regulator)